MKVFTSLLILVIFALGYQCFDFNNGGHVQLLFRGLASSLKKSIDANNLKKTLEKSIIGVNSKCGQSLQILFTKPDEEWPLIMWDSWGWLPSGLIRGTATSFGNYDQCLSISDRLVNNTLIKGKYCFLNIKHSSKVEGSPNPNIMSTGICIPSVCSQTEVTQLMRKVLSDFAFNLSVEHCSQKEDTLSVNWPQLISIFYVSLIIIAIIIGTISEQMPCSSESEQDNSLAQIPRNRMKDLLSCFSMRANTNKVFAISEMSVENELQFLDGLRVISCVLIVLGHSSLLPMAKFLKAHLAFENFNPKLLQQQIWQQFWLISQMSVQTFLMISGFLTLHLTLKQNKLKGTKPKFWQVFYFRLTRFIPVILGLYASNFMTHLISNGPLFHDDLAAGMFDPCYNSNKWWINLFFINNWWAPDQQCISHTWYLAVDFQISLLAHFLTIYYFKDRINSMLIILGLIIFGFITPIIIQSSYGIPPGFFWQFDNENHSQWYSMTEFHTHNHLMAYFSGTLVAGIVNSGSQIKLSPQIKNVTWFISLAAISIVPFSSYISMNMFADHEYLSSPSFKTFAKFIWIISMGWVILACTTFDKKGFVSNVLSAKILKPLSRLSFSVYLVNPLVVFYQIYNTRQLIPFNDWNAVLQSGGVLLLTFGFGLVFYLLFEGPAESLIKFIHFQKSNTSKKNINIIDRKLKTN